MQLLDPPGYAMPMELPIACTLTEAEMRERRRTILDRLRHQALAVTPLPLGSIYRFEPTSELLARLAQLVELERQCCPFLTFKITVPSDNQPISLEITGPPEARPLIADFFG